MKRALALIAAAGALGGCVVMVRPPAAAPAVQQPLHNPCAVVVCREAIDTRKIA